jgi:hypothetical protein
VLVAFLRRLLKQIAGKIYLIVDGHPVHQSGEATRFVATHSARLRLIRMPGYCSELNPDELLNQDVKTNGLGKSRPTTRTELMAIVRSHLYRRQKHDYQPVSRTTCPLCRVMNYALFSGRLSNNIRRPLAGNHFMRSS